MFSASGRVMHDDDETWRNDELANRLVLRAHGMRAEASNLMKGRRLSLLTLTGCKPTSGLIDTLH
jgi:hypothetical protein